MFIFSLLVACSEKESASQDTTTSNLDTAETQTEDTATDTAEAEPLECADLAVLVTWNSENLVLSFETYDELGSYYFGIAQTESAAANKWTGEDCHLGFAYGEENYSYCHPARTGLELTYGAAYGEIIEGFSTHFSGPEFENKVTYIIKEAIGGCCWVWGGSPSYYEALSCLPL